VSSNRTQAVDEVVALVSSVLENVFDGLKPVQATTEQLLAEPAGATSADLEQLRPKVAGLLTGLVVGAGYVAAPDTLTDSHLGFEWWARTEDGPPRRLLISLDPASDHFLDYTRQSWFTVPRDTGRRHITGPYVDYLCTDEYTLTFTLPVRGPRGYAGVVGADIFVREFEQLLLPRLRAVGGRCALVNAQGRVIVSTSARQATGSLVRELDVPAWWTAGAESAPRDHAALRRCGDTPIALFTS
jgi:hypothetical protein